MAATVEGTRLAEDILREIGFTRVMQWSPDINNKKGLKIEAMPNYIFEVLQYPKSYKHATKEEKEELQEAGCSLGTGDRAMQKANLDRYEARLVQRIAELQKGLPERKRLCQSLGIMGGLFLFLILV
jgi:hypothetical protein